MRLTRVSVCLTLCILFLPNIENNFFSITFLSLYSNVLFTCYGVHSPFGSLKKLDELIYATRIQCLNIYLQ